MAQTNDYIRSFIPSIHTPLDPKMSDMLSSIFGVPPDTNIKENYDEDITNKEVIIKKDKKHVVIVTILVFSLLIASCIGYPYIKNLFSDESNYRIIKSVASLVIPLTVIFWLVYSYVI